MQCCSPDKPDEQKQKKKVQELGYHILVVVLLAENGSKKGVKCRSKRRIKDIECDGGRR
jgi:hypothetical protein